jgi:phage protein D
MSAFPPGTTTPRPTERKPIRSYSRVPAQIYPVRAPQWIVTYAGVNISAEITSMVLSVEYTDKLHGEAPSVEIEIEDRDRQWQGPWYPSKGDVVDVQMGYAGEGLLDCGNFEVDEIELSGAPDVMHLRCLAAYITPALRTHNSIAYENQTLLQIANAVAAKYGFTIVSADAPLDLVFARVSQAHETDLAFLHRLAEEHGFEFTLRGTQMVFYAYQTLESQAPVLTITRSPAPGATPVLQQSYRFKDKTHQTFKQAVVTYQDPATKTLLTATATGTAATGDSKKIITRCENNSQAQLKANAELHRANMLEVTATLNTIGDPSLRAGANVALVGFGNFDGTYLIESAKHKITRSGYTTEVEGRRVS